MSGIYTGPGGQQLHGDGKPVWSHGAAPSELAPATGSAYYPLFEHMSREHGLTLLDSEMEDICRVVEQMRSAQAWAVQHKSGRITLGPESTPQLYCHRYRAAEMAKALKAHIGQCRVVHVNYRITPNIPS